MVGAEGGGLVGLEGLGRGGGELGVGEEGGGNGEEEWKGKEKGEERKRKGRRGEGFEVILGIWDLGFGGGRIG